jgi:hypothetical protein
MFGAPFYFSLLRKYVILVGTIFNNIRITRSDKDGNLTALIKVPVTYAPKDKMLARVIQDASVSRQSAVTPLPVISFEMGQMKYDGSRKLPTINKITVKGDSGKLKYQYNPVPYNIDFKVYIYAKNVEDGTKIIEQILPYFTPDWTTTVNLIPEMEISVDIPIVLNNITYSDNYSGDLKDRRAIIWTLDVTLKGYIYGPVKSAGVIKFITNNFYTPNVPDGTISDVVGSLPVIERVTLQPGLTANGESTSNINDTVAYNLINVDDDYGYITQIYNEEDIQNE